MRVFLVSFLRGKRNKKTISVLAAVCLLAFVAFSLVSCADGGNVSVISVELSDNTNSDTKFAELDFDETVIYFIVSAVTGESYSRRSIVVDQSSADSVDTKIFLRNEVVNNMIGVKINLIDSLDSRRFLGIVRPALQAGCDDYDVIGGYQAYDAGLAAGKTLFAVNCKKL